MKAHVKRNITKYLGGVLVFSVVLYILHLNLNIIHLQAQIQQDELRFQHIKAELEESQLERQRLETEWSTLVEQSERVRNFVNGDEDEGNYNQ